LADEEGWDDTTPLASYIGALKILDKIDPVEADRKRNDPLPPPQAGDKFEARKAYIEYLDLIGDPQAGQRMEDLLAGVRRFANQYPPASWGDWLDPGTLLRQYLNAVKFCDESGRTMAANQLRRIGPPPPQAGDSLEIQRAWLELRVLVGDPRGLELLREFDTEKASGELPHRIPGASGIDAPPMPRPSPWLLLRLLPALRSSTPGQPREQASTATPLPTIDELHNAMHGEIPDAHPAPMILRATWMLATIGQWIPLDAVATTDGETGSEVLYTLGFGDLMGWMRAQLAERIDQAAPDVPGVGNIIAAYISAQRAWDTTGISDPAAYRTAAGQALDDARDIYRLLLANQKPPAAAEPTGPQDDV
jgi:hypothetical protein